MFRYAGTDSPILLAYDFPQHSVSGSSTSFVEREWADTIPLAYMAHELPHPGSELYCGSP